MKKFSTYLVLTLFTIVLSLNGWAQTVVTLGGGASVTCPATPTATWTTPPAGCTFSNITRGSGVTCTSESNGWGGTPFNASGYAASYTAGDYYTLTITADATHTVTLSSITWFTTVSNSGGSSTVFTVEYNNNGGGVTTFGTTSQTGQTTNTFSGSVTIAAGTSMVVYLVASNAAASTGVVRVVNGSTFTVTSVATATPTITLSSPSQITAGSVSQGSQDQPISAFQAAVTTTAATLNSLAINTAGTYGTTDLTNFKLWYNGSANTFSAATQIGSTVTTIPASGGTVTFSGLGQSISSGSTGYFWVTASVSATGTVNKTYSGAASPTLTFAAGAPTGTITAGGAQTIIAPVNYYWNGSNAAALSSTWDNTTTNWTSPTATATPNATWPTQAAIANFNGAGGGTVTLPATLSGLPSQINIGSSNVTFAGTTPTISSPINLGSNTLTFSPTATTATLSSVISGTGGMIYNGAGTTTIPGTTINTYTGPTSITAGVLIVGADANLGTAPVSPAAGNIVIDGGARLTGTTASSFTIAANRGIAIGNNAANSISITGSGVVTYSGIIADRTGSTPGTWAKQGGGTLVLGGNSTYTGITSINNGTIQITTGNALPTGTVLTLGQASSTNLGVFDLDGNNQTVAGLNSTLGTGTGSTKNTITTSTGSAVLTITGSGSYSYGVNTTTNTGIISGAVSLVMNGSGTQALGNANTYTGTTTVTSGTLLINGSTVAGSAVSVGTSGILGGSGTANGTVSLTGTVSPGSAPSTVGILHTGAFTFNTNSTYKFEISNAGGSAGSGYDELISSGTITCSASPITIDITSLAGITFSNATSYTWTIASGSSISGFSAANFNLITTNFAPALAGGTFTIAQSGNSIVINYTPAIPALTPSPTTLSGFNYYFGAGPSTAQSFTVTGANLTASSGSITIAGSTDFEVSTTSAIAGFGSTATLSYTSTGSGAATINLNTVWVRLKTGLAVGSYSSETIGIYGGGVAIGSEATVTVSGSVSSAYYWNGPTTSGSTLTGGIGNWDNSTTNWLTAASGGSSVAWPNTSSANAFFTAGANSVVTLPASITAASANFSLTGYTLTNSAAATLTSPIILSPSVALTLAPNATTTLTIAGNVSGGSGSTIAMTGAGLTGSDFTRINLSLASSVYAVPTTITMGSSNTTVCGFVATASGVSMTSPLVLSGTRGGGRIMLNATSGNSLAISGLISGTGDIQFSAGTTGGAGTLSLTNTGNNFTGDLYMVGATSGTVQASNGTASCVPSGMGVYYPIGSQGGVFDIYGSNVTIGALSQSSSSAVGGVSNGGSSAAVLTVNQSSNTSFGPLVISNGTSILGLTKSGAGTLTLTGTHTYTGATSVSGGSLYVNGSLASGSAVTVAGGILGGSGTTAGTISINNSGAISPGSAAATVGKLTTGSQTWATGSSLNVDMSLATGTASAAGTNWDVLSTTGTIDFSSAGTNGVTINLSDNGSHTTFSPNSTYQWVVAVAGGGITGFTANKFQFNVSGFGGISGSKFVMGEGTGTAASDSLIIKYIPTGLSATPDTLSGFSTTTGTASASQSFILTATGLTAGGGTITVSAPADYQISTSSGGTYSSSLPISYTGTGTTLAQPIYVRLTAGAAAGTDDEYITISGGGASSIYVSLFGNVTVVAPTTQAYNVTFSTTTYGGFTVNWSNGNGASRIVVVTSGSSVTAGATPFTNTVPTDGNDYSSTANLNIGSAAVYGTTNYVVYAGSGSGPITISGLTPNTHYSVQVYEYNGTNGATNYLTSYTTSPSGLNPNTDVTPAVTSFYWNGGNPTVTTVAGGGTNTWNTSGTYWLPATNSGPAVAYTNTSSDIAYFNTTAANPSTNTVTVTGTSGTPITANTINIAASGYTFTNPSSTAASAYLSTSSAAGIALGQGVNLTINPVANYNFIYNGNITQASSSTGGSLTLTGNQTSPSYAAFALQGTSNISVPVTMTNTGSQQFGLVTNGTTANVTISGSLTLTSATGSVPYYIGPSTTATNTLTISGALSGSSDIAVANGPQSAGAGGKGILWLSPSTSTQNNGYTGSYHMEANSTLGSLRVCSASGVSGITSSSSVIWDLTGTGGTLDLYGGTVNINALSQTSAGAQGSVSNTSTTPATLVINQSTSTSYGVINATSMGDSISDGASKTSVIMAGTGTLTLGGKNTFTGGLILKAGLIQWGNTGNLLSNSLPVTFDGGGISTGATAGTSETVGTIQLSDNSSIYLAPGTTSSTTYQLKFADSHTISWTSGKTLTIYGWVGTAGSSGTQGQIFVGSDATALTSAQLDQISFSGYSSTGAIQLTTGEIVPAVSGYTWTGATSTAWTTITNWSPTAPAGGPHACSADVTIPVVGSGNYPILSSTVSVGNVTINSGATLTLNAPLNSCLNFTGGTTTAATILGTSPLVLNSSTGAQTISGKANINSLTIDNTSGGVSSSGTLTINNALVNTQGNFTNTGTLILSSTAGGDAYYDDFTSSTAGTYTGTMTVQRYISSTANGYRDLGSPVTGATVAALNSTYAVSGQNNVDCYYSYNPYPNVQVYNESYDLTAAPTAFDSHWFSYTSLSNPLTPLLGISFRTDVGSAYTLNFTGMPNTGALSVAVTNTAGAAPNNGWNFVGNPYPSPIKWSSVAGLNSGISSYYVFVTTGEYAGSWASYINGVGAGGATGTLPIGQGFFIRPSSSGIFSLNNTVRTATTSDPYLAPVGLSQVRLILSGQGNKDEIVAYTDSRAHGIYDPALDAEKMSAGSSVEIGYSQSDTGYAILAVNGFTAQTVLPLSIMVADTGSYSLNPENIYVPGLTAYLLDATDSSYSSLSDGPVSLQLNGYQRYSGRYYIVFEPNSTTGIATVHQSPTRIYSYGNTVYVSRPASSAAIVTVTNVIGQELKAINTHSQQLSFDMPGDQPWYAIVKVTEGEKVTVAKVLIAGK